MSSAATQDDDRTARPHTRINALFAAIGCAGLLVIGSYLTPDPRGIGTHEQLGLPPCISSNYLGVPCPLCGMTTAFTLMAHARPFDAIRAQPAGACFFFVCVLTLAGAVATLVLGRTPKPVARLADVRWGGSLTLAVLIGAWIYKLIVFYQ